MPEETHGCIPQTDEFGRTPFAASHGTGSHNDLDFGSLCVRRTVVRRAFHIASKPELLRKPLGRGSRSPGPETAQDRESPTLLPFFVVLHLDTAAALLVFLVLLLAR